MGSLVYFYTQLINGCKDVIKKDVGVYIRNMGNWGCNKYILQKGVAVQYGNIRILMPVNWNCKPKSTGIWLKNKKL